MAAIPLSAERAGETEEIDYPTSDGRPMAESTLHRKVMADLIAALEHRYEADPGVWVGGNLLLYFEQGNPQASVSPDVLLVRGIKKWDRPLYKLWEEGHPPDFVIEVTSGSTSEEDSAKKDLYERLGVSELFLFDPEWDYLDSRLQGYRLEEGGYIQLAFEPGGSMLSRLTGLRLQPEGLNLRLIDVRTGEKLLWVAEVARSQDKYAAMRRAAEERAVQDAAARRRLEEELARLRAELERTRTDG
jgi:Uma2 family endonuclease